MLGLSTLAMCAPSDKFLYMGGPLAMGLGVVFVSSIGLYKYLDLFSVMSCRLASFHSQSPLILFVSVIMGQAKTLHVASDTFPPCLLRAYLLYFFSNHCIMTGIVYCLKYYRYAHILYDITCPQTA